MVTFVLGLAPWHQALAGLDTGGLVHMQDNQSWVGCTLITPDWEGVHGDGKGAVYGASWHHLQHLPKVIVIVYP